MYLLFYLHLTESLYQLTTQNKVLTITTRHQSSDNPATTRRSSGPNTLGTQNVQHRDPCEKWTHMKWTHSRQRLWPTDQKRTCEERFFYQLSYYCRKFVLHESGEMKTFHEVESENAKVKRYLAGVFDSCC